MERGSRSGPLHPSAGLWFCRAVDIVVGGNGKRWPLLVLVEGSSFIQRLILKPELISLTLLFPAQIHAAQLREVDREVDLVWKEIWTCRRF